MRTGSIWAALASLAISAFGTTASAQPARIFDAPKPPAGFPKFQVQEIESKLKIGYAVILEDLDGDKKTDIVVVDQFQIVWYQNPTWKKRVILDGKTKPDNVCICALDIDGGGDLELVVGAGWKPFDTKNPGTLQWLKRGKSLDDEWTMHAIACDEPTVHRVRAIDLDGDGKMEVVHVPLMGRDSTREKNFMDGRPVRVMAYKVPAEPTKPENWKPEVLSEELHVCHNFAPWPSKSGGTKSGLIVTSYEGVWLLGQTPKGWECRQLGAGNQDNPKGSLGASEVKVGRLAGSKPVVATVEPWHGNQAVVYEPGTGEGLWDRRVIDGRLKWGHAVSFADIDGDGADDLLIGVRDNPVGEESTRIDKRGVRIYRKVGDKWDRYILDDGGVAVEDLAVGDLDGDGKPDIVAVGRQTFNCRIYWNKGK
jgi:FG-GAP repeat